MQFDYFYGNEAEQFTFYRIPKVLVSSPQFKKVSDSAKLLYGLMLDRMSLSIRNGWFDEKNRAYIFFTVKDIMELMCCATEKATKITAELDSEKGIGLIERVKQGQGKPAKIYLKKFISDNENYSEKSRVSEIENQDFGNPKSQTFENRKSRVSTVESAEFRKSKCNNTDNNYTDFNDAVKGGCARAMFKLGKYYYSKNIKLAEEYFTDAYRNGYTEAAKHLGEIKYNKAVDAFVNSRLDEAEMLCTEAFELGCENAADKLLEIQNVKEKQKQQEQEYFNELLYRYNNGDESIINRIALCYCHGMGVQKNIIQALYYACKAAEKYCSPDDTVYIPECSNKMLEDGFSEALSVENAGQDYYRAANMYEYLAKQGHVDAMRHLGDLYCDTLQDQTSEIGQEWSRKAKAAGHPMKNNSLKSRIELARRKDPEALSYLFHGFYYGKLLQLDKELGEAFLWIAIDRYEELANRGDASAMYELYFLYDSFEIDRVLEKNKAHEKAMYWAKRALKARHGKMLYQAAANEYDFDYNREERLELAREALKTGVSAADILIKLIQLQG